MARGIAASRLPVTWAIHRQPGFQQQRVNLFRHQRTTRRAKSLSLRLTLPPATRELFPTSPAAWRAGVKTGGRCYRRRGRMP